MRYNYSNRSPLGLIVLFLTAFSLICYDAAGQTWNQVGPSILGAENYLQLGSQVEISDDGTIMTYGVFGDNTVNTYAGAVRVFKWDGSSWNQMGSDLIGNGAVNEYFGFSLAMSADGTTVAGGGFYANSGDGLVKVWDWDGSSWVQRGGDFTGLNTGDQCGRDVSLSHDGNIMAITYYNETTVTGDVGVVRTYSWDGSSWNQVGNDIESWGPQANFGMSIDLDSAGTTLAVGAASDDSVLINAGSVAVYRFDGSSWNMLGSIFNDASANNAAGDHVRISNDGNTMAYSSHWNDDVHTDGGVVWIYEHDGSTWNAKGGPIYGAGSGDRLGSALDLSGDGDRIAIAAKYDTNPNDPGTQYAEGSIHVLDWNGSSWDVVGDTIWSGVTAYQLGSDIALNSNGYNMAVGSKDNDAYFTAGGSVQVYRSSESTGSLPQVSPGNATPNLYGNPVPLHPGTGTSVFGDLRDGELNPTVLPTPRSPESFSTHKFEIAQAQAYPNPTTGEFTLDLTASNQESLVRIFDATGRRLDEFTTNQSTTNCTIQAAPGIYWLEVIQGVNRQVLQIIKH